MTSFEKKKEGVVVAQERCPSIPANISHCDNRARGVCAPHASKISTRKREKSIHVTFAILQKIQSQRTCWEMGYLKNQIGEKLRLLFQALTVTAHSRLEDRAVQTQTAIKNVLITAALLHQTQLVG